MRLKDSEISTGILIKRTNNFINNLNIFISETL